MIRGTEQMSAAASNTAQAPSVTSAAFQVARAAMKPVVAVAWMEGVSTVSAHSIAAQEAEQSV